MCQRPRLLVDTDRVVSAEGDLACRLPGFLDSNENRTVWDKHHLTVLFKVANLVAYHVARSDGPGAADGLLRAELACLLDLSSMQSANLVARLGSDPILNRMRLTALSGGVDAALSAIDRCLDCAQFSTSPESLLYGLELLADSDRQNFAAMLRVEKLLIMWRSGRLSAMHERLAAELIQQCSEGAPQLRAELEQRLSLETPFGPSFSLAPGDTLKRALHRALVYIDALDPVPDGLLTEVISRGLVQLGEMTFVSPGTPDLWARTALRWFISRSSRHISIAQVAARQAHARLIGSTARDLDSSVGSPSPHGSAAGVIGSENVNRVMGLLQRASGADMVTSHVG
jgi:hypothetical protein